jgi:hypothetical protein
VALVARLTLFLYGVTFFSVGIAICDTSIEDHGCKVFQGGKLNSSLIAGWHLIVTSNLTYEHNGYNNARYLLWRLPEVSTLLVMLRPIMMNAMGDETFCILKSLTFPTKPDDKSLDGIVTVL